DVYLFKEKGPTAKGGDPKATGVSVTTAGGGKPAMEASSTWALGGGPAVVKPGAGAAVSRGYREEMEHFAYCIRRWDKNVSWRKEGGKYVQELPRCHGEVAMADAILALTANMAMDRKVWIPFDDDRF